MTLLSSTTEARFIPTKSQRTHESRPGKISSKSLATIPAKDYPDLTTPPLSTIFSIDLSRRWDLFLLREDFNLQGSHSSSIGLTQAAVTGQVGRL
jgi:hypothetical protein